jgi:ketosteroid isomerase-like protein
MRLPLPFAVTRLRLSSSVTTLRLSSAVAAMLLASCSSETVEQPPPAPVNWQSMQARAARDAGPNSPTANERGVAETYAAALASPGFAPLGSHLDDDAHFSFPGLDDAHGRDPIVYSHDALLGAFDHRNVTTSRVLRTSSEQTVEWTMTGVHERPWMDIAATHKPVTIKGLALLWTKDDGSITDIHLYFDVAVVKAELGIGPKELLGLAKHVGSTSGDSTTSTRPLVVEQVGSANEKFNVALARAALDALESNNLAAYEATMSDNVELYTLEHAQPLRGKAEASAYFKAKRKAIGQLDTTVTDAWGIGPFAVLEYTIAGEQLGPIGWVPAQRDKAVRFHEVDVIEVAGEKIARVWRYDNPAEVVARAL